jgi:hypothetical protein
MNCRQKKGDASVFRAMNCRPTARQRYLNELVLQSLSLLLFIDQHIKIEQVLNYFDERIVPGRFLCRLDVLLQLRTLILLFTHGTPRIGL